MWRIEANSQAMVQKLCPEARSDYMQYATVYTYHVFTLYLPTMYLLLRIYRGINHYRNVGYNLSSSTAISDSLRLDSL